MTLYVCKDKEEELVIMGQEKDKNFLNSIDYGMDIGENLYEEYRCLLLVEAKKETDETRIYNCGYLPVELTLPEGEHRVCILYLHGEYNGMFEEEINLINKYGRR